jgi:hypothetical protein
MRQERLQEADPEVGNERDAERPEELGPQDRADRSRQRERDKIRRKGGEANDDRPALAALERPPDECAHDDDL